MYSFDIKNEDVVKINKALKSKINICKYPPNVRVKVYDTGILEVSLLCTSPDLSRNSGCGALHCNNCAKKEMPVFNPLM